MVEGHFGNSTWLSSQARKVLLDHINGLNNPAISNYLAQVYTYSRLLAGINSINTIAMLDALEARVSGFVYT